MNKFRIDGDTCIIETDTPKTGKLEFLIDAEDFNRVKCHHWIPRRDKLGAFYAVTSFRYMDSGKHLRAQIQLHNFISSFSDGIKDHINGNSQDNRKSNIRTVSVQQNCMNRGFNKKSKHNGKGFCLEKASGRFKAYIYLNAKCKSLGSYKTRNEAAIAYNNAATIHFGEYARLNEVV
jgi:hypothetical protein